MVKISVFIREIRVRTILQKKAFLSVSDVFPRMLALVAKQRVVVAGVVQELALKHKALAASQKLVERKTTDEGFYNVFVEISV